MPYPRSLPEAKHDLVSPLTISISSGKLQPVFDSTDRIIQQVKEKNVKLQKLALKVYTYSDAPSKPRKPSQALFFAGFCRLSSIASRQDGVLADSSRFRHKNMTLCHMAVKRIDQNNNATTSLPQHDLDNSNKFKFLCRNLRKHELVALIQCPKTNRAGFLIPMNEVEDGSDFAAYCYIGDIDAVEQMLLDVEQAKGPYDYNGNGHASSHDDNNVQESDEPVWKPDDDNYDNEKEDDNHNHDRTTNEGGGDTNNDMIWQPPGSSNNNNGQHVDTQNYMGGGDDDDNQMWKPPGDNDNNDSTSDLWQPPGSSNSGNNNNNDDNNLWNQSDNATEKNNLWQQQASSSDTNNANMISQETTFHSDTGAAAADKFYSELNRSLGTSADSILFHMRKFNNWVKATQIAELDPNTLLAGGTNSRNNKKRKRSRHPLRILDLACGKGGDLGKWVLHNRGVQSYVGSDVARGSLVDAAIRARKMTKQLRNKCTFVCADLGSDVPGRPKNRLRGGKLQKLLSWSLENDNGLGDPVFRDIRGGGIKESDKFDVISIQFAIHYMMSSEKRARRFFQTVSELLAIGGNLIATTIDARVVMNHMMDAGYNFHFDDDGGGGDGGGKENEYMTIKVGLDACQLKFHRDIVKRIFQSNQASKIGTINPNLFGLEYTFTLIEGQDHAAGVGQAVDLPEWLTPLPVLKQLAAEAGLSMEYASNFHEFFEERKDHNVNHTAYSALYNMNVLNWNGTISDQEWDISQMYVAVKFRKDRESVMVLDDDDDDEDMEEESDEDDEMDEVDEFDQPEPTPTPKATKPLIEVNMKDPAVVKLYTKAMAKARVAYSGDWKSLASDERKALINEELANMM